MIGSSGSREPFVPYRTMFKLPALRKATGLQAISPSPLSIRSSVLCVECGAAFPLSDLLSGELEENQCPLCKTTAEEYWAGIPSRPLPEHT